MAAGKGSTFAFYVKARRAAGTSLNESTQTTAEDQASANVIDTVNSTSGRHKSAKAPLSQEDYTQIPVLIVEGSCKLRCDEAATNLHYRQPSQ